MEKEACKKSLNDFKRRFPESNIFRPHSYQDMMVILLRTLSSGIMLQR